MKAIASARRTRNTSKPPGDGRASTTVDAGRAGAMVTGRAYPALGADASLGHGGDADGMARFLLDFQQGDEEWPGFIAGLRPEEER